MSKPLLLLDFDGVIHRYDSPWTGVDKISDGPVAGALWWMRHAMEVFDVAVYSSRSVDPAGVAAMQDWFRIHAAAEFGNSGIADAFCANITYPTKKGSAFLTIDDRAITFEGDWSKLDLKELLKFKAWNKRK